MNVVSALDLTHCLSLRVCKKSCWMTPVIVGIFENLKQIDSKCLCQCMSYQELTAPTVPLHTLWHLIYIGCQINKLVRHVLCGSSKETVS